MNVVITGGGTAGHVFPALAVAAELRERGDAVIFVGSADGQEARLVPAAGYRFEAVRAISAQTRFSMRSVRAFALAIRASRSIRPLIAGVDAVVGVGGFASAPGVLAARSTGRPLVLVDPNSVPGIVNRIAARWARVVATAFEATAAHLPAGTRVERTGNPIRAEIAAVAADRARLAEEARKVFGLEDGRGTIVVVGGSQGALHLDRAVSDTLGPLSQRADLQVLVSSGPAHEAVLRDAIDPSAPLLVRVVPFIDRMDLALAVADLAVSRAGASVAELAACGLPAILVPYPHATDQHQDPNAHEVAAAGAAVVVEDEALDGIVLARAILELIDDPARLAAMASAALAWARPDAARRVADLVREVAG